MYSQPLTDFLYSDFASGLLHAVWLWKWHYMWPSMLTHTRNLCSAFNPSKVHTHSSKRTHTHTHTRQRLGSSWGFDALLKVTSVVVLKVEESAVYSLPPLTIPARHETQTRNLWVMSPTLKTLGHDFPTVKSFIDCVEMLRLACGIAKIFPTKNRA